MMESKTVITVEQKGDNRTFFAVSRSDIQQRQLCEDLVKIWYLGMMLFLNFAKTRGYVLVIFVISDFVIFFEHFIYIALKAIDVQIFSKKLRAAQDDFFDRVWIRCAGQ